MSESKTEYEFKPRPQAIISMPVEERDKLVADARREAFKFSSICEVCGKEFFQNRKRSTCCSLACGHIKSQRTMAARRPPIGDRTINLPKGLEVLFEDDLIPKNEYGNLYLHKNGYISIMGLKSKKVRGLNRVTMECFLGRKLSATEFVHHKNHNPLDNRLENLEILSDKEHKATHGKVVGKFPVACPDCGTVREFYYNQYLQSIGRLCHRCASKKVNLKTNGHIIHFWYIFEPSQIIGPYNSLRNLKNNPTSFEKRNTAPISYNRKTGRFFRLAGHIPEKAKSLIIDYCDKLIERG